MPVSAEVAPSSVPTRPARSDDLPALARLHADAYRNTFDRFLFLLYLDPERDAELTTREILNGRWGEFLPWASPVVERGGAIRAAVLVVRASYGPLIADVMVDPTVRGQGLGRAVLLAAVAALRERRESVAVLNVTEGNERAIALYRRVGFVRSLGPSRGWYGRDRISVPPGTD
jgi:ribosomal protein S18 acetylase RimI-like enzyme